MFEKEVIIAGLQSQLAAYAELKDKAEEYRNADEVAKMFIWTDEIKPERHRFYLDWRDKCQANLFAALDKLEVGN